MTENKGLLSSGWSKVVYNGRYVFWFWFMNLVLGVFASATLKSQMERFLQHSLLSDRLLHGFDLTVLLEMLARPDFGPQSAPMETGMHFAVVFFLATALLLPGVFQGYASNYRLPRDEFFRACGRNLWRFIRLVFVGGIVMGIIAAGLFTLHGLLGKQAGESTNELLLPWVQGIGLFVIFLVMATLRISFDLAEADTVLDDQRAVRKSIAKGFRHTFRSLGRLLGSYILITIVALIILAGGFLVWLKFVPSPSVVGAFVVSQVILGLLLALRFWQRGVAVAYWQQKMVAPVAVMAPVAPAAPVSVVPGIPPTPAVEGI
jgi:hypothetical protein